MIYKELTSEIISAFYTVYNTLQSGFLESVYENSLLIELRKRGLKCEKQKEITVYYEGQVVGHYYADIVVEKKVILELKAAECIHPRHEAQLMNYLRATKIEVGLLLNFGKEAKFCRRICTND